MISSQLFALLFSACLLGLAFSAPTPLAANYNATAGSSDPNSCQTNIVEIEVEIKAVTSGKMKCDYNYVDGTCGNIPIVYTEGKSPHDTVVKYTPQSFKVQTTNGATVATFNAGTVDIPPMTKNINKENNGITLIVSLSCKCSYQEVLHDDSGFYCRIPNASLPEVTVPVPTVYKTSPNVFYPFGLQRCL